MTPSFTVSVDRARGRILTALSKEASVQRLEEADLCREGDGAQARRTPGQAIQYSSRSAPGLYIALGPGRTQETRAPRGAETSLAAP